MITYDADRAIVIIGRVLVGMQGCHERGYKEQQNKNCGKTAVSVHDPFLA
ncbi:MAG: hypothetical protein ACM32I_04915 [Nitrospirota bacterium]